MGQANAKDSRMLSEETPHTSGVILKFPTKNKLWRGFVDTFEA